MQIPDGSIVHPFDAAEIGRLLIGRLSNEGPNFVAIRTEAPGPSGDGTAYMAILPPNEEHDARPFLCNPVSGPTKVLNLGFHWTIDVEIDEESPAFDVATEGAMIIRSGERFYMRMYR